MARDSKRKYKPLLGYSTNVHPGETVDQVYSFLRDFTIPIRDRVFGKGEKAGLELRLGIGSAKELATKKARREFREFLDESGLQLFSVNAFPLLDFHARRVKEKVYLPSWADAKRGNWTSRIAKIVAEVAPEEVNPSISTLGGCFRRAHHDDKTFKKMAKVFLSCLETFVELGENGRHMVLAAEPEPETSFEIAQDVVDFFENYLLPEAFSSWKAHGKRARIEELVRRHFTVNVDTCHFSVLFQDQVKSLRTLTKAGLKVGKLHVTNAVSLPNPYRSPAAYQDLRSMDEPRYFHQFCGVDKTGKTIWRDLDLDRLPKKLIRGEHPDVAELRSHFHVPLYMKRYLKCRTTQDETEAAVREVVRRKLTDHLVLETYTWPVITGTDKRSKARDAKIIDGTAKEFRWLLDVLDRA